LISIPSDRQPGGAGNTLFSTQPIRKQMFFIAFLTIAAVIGLQLFNYNQTARLVTKKNEANTSDIFLQIKQTIGSNYDVIKSLSYNVGYNRTVQDLLLAEPEMLPNKKIETYQQISNLLFNLSTLNSGILDLVIIGKNGAKLSLNSGVSDIESFGSSVMEDKQPVYSGVKECFAGGPSKKSCIAVGTTVYSNVPYDRYTNKIGSIYILIDPKMLVGGNEPETKQEGTTLFLLDRNGKVFLGTDSLMLNRPFDTRRLHEEKTGLTNVNGVLTHIQMDDLPEIGGQIVRLIPDNVFYHDVRLLRKWSIMAIAAGLALLSIPFFLILNNVISPLRSLYHLMRIRKPDDLNKAIKLRGSTEAEAIAKQFNQMMQQIKELTHELVDSKGKLLHSEIEMKRAEYAFLKSQVNPHFLYNTLDAIRGIALERKVPEIIEVTRSLSRIFRYSVKGHDFVTLNEELDIVSAYMQIQTFRFANRFDLDLEVGDPLMSCRIPKMILQPIVENAVYHGLEPRSSKGKLTITAWEENGQDLFIRIADDGAGIPEEKLRYIQHRLQYGRSADIGGKEAGIGILNIHNRLKLIYGDEYGIELHSSKDQGTKVVLKLSKDWGGER
jgi:two-component system, sensor histidine kinase YesM